jgi:hypothetical protein
MTKPMRRKLFWIGIALIVLPTILLVITLFQPREYQSVVFVEVGKPGVVTHAESADHTMLYAILILFGVYLPGSALLFTALFGHRLRRTSSGPPDI